MQLCSSHSFLAALFCLQILSQRSVLAEGEPCYKAANNSPGTCISLKDCLPYVSLLKEQGTQAGPFLRSTLCYFQGRDPVVCCPPVNNQPFTEAPVPTKPPNTRPFPGTPQPFPQPQEKIYGDAFDRLNCGFTNVTHTRVVGGLPAQPESYPWIAALGYRSSKNPRKVQWRCGGTMLSAEYVLTAAHCVFNRTDVWKVRLGEHNIQSDDDGANPIDVNIKMIIMHPGYSHVNYVNDIAILKLARPVPFSSAIHPVCLPTPEMKNKNYAGNFPFIAGWGAVGFHAPSAAVLQEAQVQVTTLEECQQAFQRFKEQVIDERVICAGIRAGGVDACQGDSGGPLVHPKSSSEFTIIGIVSFGYRCGEPNIPGVYTRVSYFLEWIQYVMSNY